MKLIIDIDDDYYELVKHDVEIYHNDFLPFRLIAKGTPLPKGHGRLIDADYLREDFKASKKISFAERMDISCIVDHAPTIIETDKEG